MACNEHASACLLLALQNLTDLKVQIDHFATSMTVVWSFEAHVHVVNSIMPTTLASAFAVVLAVAVLPTSLAQDNSSYVNYNVEPQPNLYPETLETPRLYFPDCKTGPLSRTIVCDTSARPEERAAALVSLFTLDELVNHTGNTIPAIPRLGLPDYEVWSETLHGVDHADWAKSGKFSWATSFPQAILTAASLNRPLFHQIGEIIAAQGRAFNNDGRFGLDGYYPNVNGFRSPIWGRARKLQEKTPTVSPPLTPMSILPACKEGWNLSALGLPPRPSTLLGTTLRTGTGTRVWGMT